MPKQARLPQQEVFIERIVISDLNFRIRVKDILDGNLLRNNLSEIGGQISGGGPFQQIVFCAGRHARRQLFGSWHFNGIHGCQ